MTSRAEMSHRYRTQYLRSSGWRRRRAAFIRKVGPYCRGCSKQQGRLDVHHRYDDNLGHEPDADLVVVCRSCHADVHRVIDSGKYRTRREATYMALKQLKAKRKAWERRQRLSDRFWFWIIRKLGW